MTTLTNLLPEQAVLGCLLQADLPSASELVALLDPQDFVDPRHRAAFEAASFCVESATAPDPVTVLAYMREQGDALADTAASSAGPFLVELMRAAPSLGSATYYAKALIQDSFRRRVQETGERLSQASESASLDALLDILRSEWTAVAVLKTRLVGVIA